MAFDSIVAMSACTTKSTARDIPILLFAPGGMRSAIPFWRGSEWDPIEALSPHFQVIAMDQRNAGQSTAPVIRQTTAGTPTRRTTSRCSTTSAIEKTHSDGRVYRRSLQLRRHPRRDPDRVAAAVLQQSIGDNGENRELFHAMFDQWANPLKPSMPSVSEETWASFRSNMFDHEFVYNVSREFVASCQTPLLVLKGSDPYHPESTSREIADLAPNARLVEEWKNPDADGTVETVVEFLKTHTPDG